MPRVGYGRGGSTFAPSRIEAHGAMPAMPLGPNLHGGPRQVRGCGVPAGVSPFCPAGFLLPKVPHVLGAGAQGQPVEET